MGAATVADSEIRCWTPKDTDTRDTENGVHGWEEYSRMRSRNSRAEVGAHACHRLDQESVGDCVLNRSDTVTERSRISCEHIMS